MLWSVLAVNNILLNVIFVDNRRIKRNFFLANRNQEKNDQMATSNAVFNSKWNSLILCVFVIMLFLEPKKIESICTTTAKT